MRQARTLPSSRTGRFVLACLAVGCAIAAQAAWSARSSLAADKPVKACVKGSTVTVPKAGKRCPSGAKTVTWNLPGAKGPAGLVGSKLENANGLACHVSAGGAIGHITVHVDAKTGVVTFECA
jgi:hypothetical protein